VVSCAVGSDHRRVLLHQTPVRLGPRAQGSRETALGGLSIPSQPSEDHTNTYRMSPFGSSATIRAGDAPTDRTSAPARGRLTAVDRLWPRRSPLALGGRSPLSVADVADSGYQLPPGQAGRSALRACPVERRRGYTRQGRRRKCRSASRFERSRSSRSRSRCRARCRRKIRPSATRGRRRASPSRCPPPSRARRARRPRLCGAALRLAGLAARRGGGGAAAAQRRLRDALAAAAAAPCRVPRLGSPRRPPGPSGGLPLRHLRRLRAGARARLPGQRRPLHAEDAALPVRVWPRVPLG